MKYFLKINVASILYSVFAFIPLELMANVYRISRLTNWEISIVIRLSGAVIIIEIITATTLLFFLTKKWLGMRKANFWTAILWVPYFVLFVYIFASLFPITNGGDAPNPVIGFLAIGGLAAFPFYILILNAVGMNSSQKTFVE